MNGPPASSLRKAVITCVLPSILYGTEAWYAGCTKASCNDQNEMVSTQNGWHMEVVDKTLTLAT